MLSPKPLKPGYGLVPLLPVASTSMFEPHGKRTFSASFANSNDADLARVFCAAPASVAFWRRVRIASFKSHRLAFETYVFTRRQHVALTSASQVKKCWTWRTAWRCAATFRFRKTFVMLERQLLHLCFRPRHHNKLWLNLIAHMLRALSGCSVTGHWGLAGHSHLLLLPTGVKQLLPFSIAAASPGI